MTATVDGSRAYRVRLEIARTGLHGHCTCPYVAEGAFCKHCVATALAWLDAGGTVGDPRGPRGPRPEPMSDARLREFLLGQEPAWLVDHLLAVAGHGTLLRARLEVAAGADAHSAYDDRELRSRLEQAIEIDDYIDYHEAYSYVGGVDAVLDEVAELVDGGLPDTAIGLAEYAIELLEGAAGLVDDSDGAVGEAIARAEDIHLGACVAGTPDPGALAERLVDGALCSDHEVFRDALPNYEEVLGPVGIARYRELVEQAWAALPPKKPRDYDTRRFAVSHLMERVAEASGGADALIEVLARDVVSGYDVLRIAERLCVDGRDDEALTWLERGMAEFEPDERVRRLAADCHLRADRRAEAAELLWQNFAERPNLVAYQELGEAAGDAAAGWRARALALLRDQPAAHGPWRPDSVLVEILLAEGDTDGAWQAAVDLGCPEEQWLRLARVRAPTHPADAIPVLMRAANREIAQKNRTSYQIAARLLAEARRLSVRCGRDDDFDGHVAVLRETHRSRWAFREELDRAGLP